MKKNKAGLFIIPGICTAMIVITILQITLFTEARDLAVRTSVVNIILGTGGMIVLFYLGNKIQRKLNTLEDMVRPFEEKNYSALIASGSAAYGQVAETAESPDVESYRDLKKAALDLGKFAEAFRAHAGSIAEMEELLEKETDTLKSHSTVLSNAENRQTQDRQINEIEEATEKAVCALEEVDKYISSFNEISRKQDQAMEEAEIRLEAATELSRSIACNIEESGKVSLDLRGKISAGDEESRNAHDIIKNTSKELEKIIALADVINEISDKTNMLSMNAAIESAHAGAAGAGFAVVSDEIRKLAELTRENAGDIQAVLKTITAQIAEALRASEKSSATFSLITKEISAFTGRLETAANDARNNSDAGHEIKTALAGSKVKTMEIQGGSMDVELIKNNFHSALNAIQSVSAAANHRANESDAELIKCRENLEKTLEKVRDYFKETEKLKGMFFSGGGFSQDMAYKNVESKDGVKTDSPDSSLSLRFTVDPKIAAAAVEPKTAAVAPKVVEPKATAVAPKAVVPKVAVDVPKATAVAIVEQPNVVAVAPKAVEETDDSWRKDVTVKSPPQTVL